MRGESCACGVRSRKDGWEALQRGRVPTKALRIQCCSEDRLPPVSSSYRINCSLGVMNELTVLKVSQKSLDQPFSGCSSMAKWRV